MNVRAGWRRVEEGDHFGALLPFAEAFALEQDKPDRAEIHQMRLASVLQRSPKLVNVWNVGTNINHAEFSRDGSRLLTTTWEANGPVARIWNSTTGEALTQKAALSGAGRGVQHDETAEPRSLKATIGVGANPIRS